MPIRTWYAGRVMVGTEPAIRRVRITSWTKELVGAVMEYKQIADIASDSNGDFRVEVSPSTKPAMIVVYDDTGETWAANMSLALGARVHPTTGKETGYYYECVAPGTTGSEEPAWWIDTGSTNTGMTGTATLQAKPYYQPIAHGPVYPEIEQIGDPSAQPDIDVQGVPYYHNQTIELSGIQSFEFVNYADANDKLYRRVSDGTFISPYAARAVQLGARNLMMLDDSDDTARDIIGTLTGVMINVEKQNRCIIKHQRKSARWPGSTQSGVSLPGVIVSNVNGDFTVNYWICPEKQGYMTHISCYSEPSNLMIMANNNNAAQFDKYPPPGGAMFAYYYYQTNQPQMMTFVQNATTRTIKAYSNGAYKGQGGMEDMVVAPTLTRIGARFPGDTLVMTGNIGGVASFDRVLTDAEIADLYNLGKI